MMHLYSALLCIAVHPKCFTIVGGGDQCAASTWIMRRLPQDNGTLLVPGWTHFCLQNCLNSSWHWFNKVLKTFLRDLIHIDIFCNCCRFVGCSSMMRISHSTTSQRCSIRLLSGDCGGHLSKVNSLSCSRNQSEMIWALCYGALSS